MLLDEGIELLRQKVERRAELAKGIEQDEVVKRIVARELDPGVALDDAKAIRLSYPEVLLGDRDDAGLQFDDIDLGIWHGAPNTSTPTRHRGRSSEFVWSLPGTGDRPS